jgi:hypothetical protein
MNIYIYMCMEHMIYICILRKLLATPIIPIGLGKTCRLQLPLIQAHGHPMTPHIVLEPNDAGYEAKSAGLVGGTG